MKKRGFDVIVITASNEAQARGYRAAVAPLVGELADEIVVVPDPGGKRVGSLGSTVEVLKTIGPVGRRRVLVCHSGGDSKRLPAYAATGKAFVPVPQPDGTMPTLFEVIVGNMSKLRLPESGMLVVCGDVAPEFDFAKCDFSGSGVTGVGYIDGPEEARRHGVYLTQLRRNRGAAKVTEFLQKPAVEKGRHIIDTGILWIDCATAAKMLASGWKEGDLYEKFTDELVKGYAPFRVNVVKRCRFFHIGSSLELLGQLGGGKEWIDGCEIAREEMKLGGRNLVTGVPRSYGKVELGEGECLMSLPIGEKAWKHIRYRVTDTFKTDGLWERHHLGELMPKVNHARMIPRSAVTVSNPLRIDLGGGWSDTPPICNELGGAVFNAAIALGGMKSVKATVKRLAAREVRVESIDLGRSGVYRTDAEIADHSNPHDWGALVKSALTVVGYRIVEGGLEIRISAEVPKGSGMGTSSILGATLIQALGKVRGRNYDWRETAELTLRLEQEMRTGGGWQDQIGGIVPGVKLLVSSAGKAQKVSVRRMDAAAERRFAKFLDERALLYFTGQKRMARNVLRGVIGFYRRNPAGIAKAIVGRLKRDAKMCFEAVRRGEWGRFCGAVNAYWMSKKALDPGSTNPAVESIIARISPWTEAVTLCGAGGGGFMFIVARDAKSKARLRSTLEKYPPVSSGRFYDFALAGD